MRRNPLSARGPLAAAAVLAAALLLSGAAAAQPAVSETLEPIDAPPGTLFATDAADVFDDAGTNPRFLSVSFSTGDYYGPDSGVYGVGRLWVEVKSEEKLNALPSPPPSPFTVTATVTMINDALVTAKGAIEFRTTYARNPAPATPTPDPTLQPVPVQR